jgi:sugar lactone lactonase YvrE
VTGTLSWVDLHAGVFHRWDGSGCRAYSLGGPLSAARPGPDGLIVVQGNRVGLVTDLDAAEPVQSQATVPLGAADRCNDAQLDPWGRLWVGTMAPTQPGAAALHILELDAREPTVVCSGLTLANGIGWSPDRDRVYVVDTGTATVLSARLDVDGRPRTAFEPLLDLSDRPGAPDGLCVDADGGIWVAMFGAGQLHCLDPSGALRQILDLPLRYPTSVVFAGADLDELVVTTARRTPKVFDPATDAGRLLALRPGVRGVGFPGDRPAGS